MTHPTTKVTAKCACGAFNYTINFLNSSLPIDRALCLCNSCRKLSGSCGISYIALPAGQSFDPTTWNLKTYKTSDSLARHFCGTCGGHVAVHRPSDGLLAIATGLWDRTEGIIKWTGCKFVSDTRDGGISVWMRDIVDQSGESRGLRRWLRQDGINPEASPESFRKLVDTKTQGGADEKLRASCHCGGVKFYITRPNEASRKVQSPFSDLLVPYHTGTPANPKNETWWLRSNNSKYMAGTCTCETCRRASGFEFQPWAFIPKCNIFQENSNEMNYDMGTLQRYISSKNTYREFCSVCGATVFWHNDNRSELIDVSIGLLDPEEGARAEHWLDWCAERVSFKEMAVSQDLANSLEDGLKRWNSEEHS